MALVLADRVKETTDTTGTGTYSLSGGLAGFQTFNSAIGNGNTTYYTCTDGTNFEIGIGTYTSSGNTLARTTILKSSNSNSAVNWGTSTKDIFVTYPADKSVFKDASDNISGLGTASALDTGISNNNVPKFTSGVVDDDFLRVDGTTIEGRSAAEVLSDIGGQASLTFGISDTNAVKIDSSSVADDEYARFTSSGLESRSTAEVLSDIGGQASLTFGKSSSNALKLEEAVTTNDVLLAGSSDVKGRTFSELKSDLSLDNVENTALSTGTALNATHVLVTDNESTNENNLITFVEDATSSTGNVGLEMDGNLTYNPSSGNLTATQLTGTLQTAAQSNITSVGTLTGLTTSGTINLSQTSGAAIKTTGTLSTADLTLLRASASTDGEFGFDIKYMGSRSGNNNSYSLFMHNQTGTDVEAMTVLQDGKVGINNTSPSAPLDVSGDAEITGTLTAGEVSATTLDIGGTNITSTATEINKLDGVTATTTELNYVDVTTLGTVEASKAVTADSGADVTFPSGSIINLESDASNPVIKITGGGPNFIRFFDVSSSTNAVDIVYRTTPNDLLIERSNGNNIAEFGGDDGHAALYFDDSMKLETTTDGVTITGTLATDGVTLGDSEEVQFGAGTDLRIYHNGSHSFIREQGTGDLKIQSTNLSIEQGDGTLLLDTNDSTNAVQLYDNGELRLRTTDTGIDVLCEDSDSGSDNTANIRIVSEGTNEILTLRSNDGVGSYIIRNGSSHGDHLFQSFNGTDTTSLLRLTTTGHTFEQGVTVTGKLDAGILEGKGGVTYDPPGSSGSDTATDVAVAVHSGDRIVLGENGYIRTIVDATWGSALQIGQSGTGAFAGTEIYGGNDGVTLKHSTNTKLETNSDGAETTGVHTVAHTNGQRNGMYTNSDGQLVFFRNNYSNNETTLVIDDETGDVTIGSDLTVDEVFVGSSTDHKVGKVNHTYGDGIGLTTDNGTVTIGQGNGSYTHYFNSNNVPHWFNKQVIADGGFSVWGTNDNITLKAGGVIFEGATADDYETTLNVVDPTADRAINLPDAAGTVALKSEYFQAFTSSNSGNLTSSFVTVDFDTITLNSNGSVFSESGGEVTVNKTGVFRFHADITTQMTSSSSRSDCEMEIQKKPSGGSYSSVAGTMAMTYNRTVGLGQQTATIDFLISVTSGDTYKVVVKRQSGSADIQVEADGARLNIQEIN